jgi:TAG lipase/steryl ester hydrolase/phospholipase A2/LPA acyltransferase|tara:strand:- start:424 stop:810 length:387 start_codon:yes stop_codon:yes gene_type:complete
MALHFCKHGVLMDGDEFGNTTKVRVAPFPNPSTHCLPIQDVNHFSSTLTKAYFGDTTFAEAFHISKRAVSIQVSVGSGHGFVLNHFTSPTVVVRTAVNASCALPGLMEPFELLAKDGKTGTALGLSQI